MCIYIYIDICGYMCIKGFIGFRSSSASKTTFRGKGFEGFRGLRAEGV